MASDDVTTYKSNFKKNTPGYYDYIKCENAEGYFKKNTAIDQLRDSKYTNNIKSIGFRYFFGLDTNDQSNQIRIILVAVQKGGNNLIIKGMVKETSRPHKP